jgi:hypothetical protein
LHERHCEGHTTHLIRVLSLEVVDIATIYHVACIDEELCSPHGLQEITRSFHLTHKIDEKLSAGICVNSLHQPVDATYDTFRIRKSVVVFNRWVDSSCIRCNRSWVSDSSGRSKDRYRIVGRTVRHHSHSDEHDQEVDENRSIC